MSIGEELIVERRERRRAGDPRLTPEGREILRRISSGDLAEEFSASLTDISEADSLLSENPDDD